jgi:hypothetical protein
MKALVLLADNELEKAASFAKQLLSMRSPRR